MTPWETRLAAVQAVLPADLTLLDHETFAELIDDEGNHIALVGFDPLQVEFELSVVLFEEADVDTDALIAEAHALLDQVHAETWADKGFQIGEDGEVHEGEVEDEPERVIISYDRPFTARVPDPAGLAALVAWAREQTMDFVVGI